MPTIRMFSLRKILSKVKRNILLKKYKSIDRDAVGLFSIILCGLTNVCYLNKKKDE